MDNQDLDRQLGDAAFKGFAEECEALISRGASVRGDATCRQFTPLQSAALGGHPAVCALLIKHGADVAAKGHGDLTALQIAVYDGQIDVVEYLVRHCGEDINQITHDGVSLDDLAGELTKGDQPADMIACLAGLRSEMTARVVGGAIGDAEVREMVKARRPTGPPSL
jgi:hypothetical protein